MTARDELCAAFLEVCRPAGEVLPAPSPVPPVPRPPMALPIRRTPTPRRRNA